MTRNVVVHEVALPPIGKYTVHMTATLIRDDIVEMRLDAYTPDPTDDCTDFVYANWEDFECLYKRYELYQDMYMKLAQVVFDEAFYAANEIREFLRG